MTTVSRIRTADGIELEAELSVAPDEHARMVLCHPHPLHGGTMRSLVVSELFRALPEAGITCLRFNFRGVGESLGTHDHGDGERLDVVAALEACGTSSRSLVLAGWSFGGDIALSLHAPEIAGWIAIAPPLRFGHQFDAVAADPRPKLVILAAHDEFRPAAEVAGITREWLATTTETIAGASHFFVGRTERVVDLVRSWVEGEIVDSRA